VDALDAARVVEVVRQLEAPLCGLLLRLEALDLGQRGADRVAVPVVFRWRA
jgi:hypothetical protein